MKEITNESEYEKTSDRADEIFYAKKGTPEHDELQELLKALKKYDDDFVKIVRSEVELALSSDRPDIPLDFNGLSGIKSLLEMDLGIFENSTYSV